MSVQARLEQDRLDAERELGALIAEAKDAGAVVSFVGIARPSSGSGTPVDGLILEHHPTLTRQSLEDIARAAAARFGVSHVRVVHRCGDITPGEAIVFAGAAADHRRAAFDAADYLMDRLKTDAIFWKREVGPGGSEWIEPRQGDYADRNRWD